MEASKSLSCENNNSTLFSAVPDSSNMYSNKDSNLISIYMYVEKQVGSLLMSSVGHMILLLGIFLV